MSAVPPLSIDRLASPGGPTLLRLRGTLDYGSVAHLRACLAEYPGTAIVIELRGLVLLDSSGLAELLRAARRGVRVHGAEGRVLRMLERTRTLEIFAQAAG
jgi:anti-anti-sigma regulatory factor